jgi:hypothetical protein
MVRFCFSTQAPDNPFMFTCCQENSPLVAASSTPEARLRRRCTVRALATDGSALKALSLADRFQGADLNQSTHERRQALLALLRQSLEKGHWRVALRRFFMLRSLGLAVPAEVSAICERFMRRCADRELASMHQSAQDLAAMVIPSRGNPDYKTPVDKYDYLHAISRTGTNAERTQ